MFVLSLIAYGIVGLIAGFLGSLLSISGGLITVPCLFLIFTLLKFPHVYLMQLVIGTSLAAMVFNAIVATYSHARQKEVNWKFVRAMLPGLILGCICGAFISYLLPNSFLQIIFAVFAIGFGIYFYRSHSAPLRDTKPKQGRLGGIAFGLGALSNILGMGGGTMMVPLFVKYKFPMKIAIGSAAATGFIVSLVGAVSFLLIGLEETYYENTIGYIYLPAFVILSITTMIAAPFGARMTHTIHSLKLKKYFALALIVLGLTMIIR